jgi:hypothetical protein
MMKRIKRFAMFESITVWPDKVCSLYEDARSIGYILEDEGIAVEYWLRMVRTGRGSLQKELVSVRVGSCEDIRRALSIDSLRELVIYAGNPVKGKADSEQEAEFRKEFERYYEILKDHLDYVDSRFIECRGFRPPLNFEIRIAAPFFM